VFAIGSPIFWLARWSDRLTPPSDTAGGSSGKS
jgi:hypothetical protein